jgi:HEAT repeat protein
VELFTATSSVKSHSEINTQRSQYIQELISHLNDRKKVAHDAAQALANMGAPAHPAFSALVAAASRRSDIRDVAIYAIAQIADGLGKRLSKGEAETALPALISALSDSRENVREVAAYALGRLSESLTGTRESPSATRAILALISRASDPKPKVQRAALEALGRFREDDALGDNGTEAVTALRKALNNANRQSGADWQKVQMDCSAALERFGSAASDAVPELVFALQNGSPAVQRAAAYAIAHIGPSANAAVPALISGLSDGEKEVRQVSAYALGQIQSAAPQTIPALVSALKDSNSEVRKAARAALQTYSQTQEAFPFLLAAMSDSDAQVRTVAAQSLGEMAEHKRLSTADLERAQIALRAAVHSDALDQASRNVCNEALEAVDRRMEERMPWWKRHPRIAIVLTVIGAYLLHFLILRFALLRLCPLRVLRWNERLSPSTGLTVWKLKIPLKYALLFGFFHYCPQVLDAWVEQHVARVRENFAKRETVQIRSTYVALPVTVRTGGNERSVACLTPQDLLQARSEDYRCIRILGEGGAGKTTLACQLAFWAMESDVSKRLSAAHQMLPVLIEPALGSQIRNDLEQLTGAIQGQLEELMGLAEPIPAGLLDRLLRTRRILVILDGISEMDNAPHGSELDKATLGSPRFPVAALLTTSRTEEHFLHNSHFDIHAMRIDSNHLIRFMNAYLEKANVSLGDAQLLEACSRLALIVKSQESAANFKRSEIMRAFGTTTYNTGGITPLLARIYAQALIGFCKYSRSLEDLPSTVPDLIIAYLNELNEPIKDREDHIRVHRAAKRVGWECMKKNFRPGRAAKNSVQDDPDTMSMLPYLEKRLQIIDTIPPSQTDFQFTLDALAEYLGALYKLEECGPELDKWEQFLKEADSHAKFSGGIEEFLLAVADCLRSRGESVGLAPGTIEELVNRTNQVLQQKIVASDPSDLPPVVGPRSGKPS